MALILTIDDEASIRMSICAYLEDLGHTVIEAEGGVQGLAIFEQQQPDLVLVDIRMGDLDGLAVLTTVTEKSPETPIIMISGTGDISDVVEALRMGAWNYLTKPIQNMDVLIHAIEQALERASLLQEYKSYQLHLETEVSKRTRDLNSLINNLPIGLYRITAGSSEAISMANPAIAHMFGYASPEIFCNSTTFEQLFTDQQEAGLLLEKLRQSGNSATQEVELLRTDGTRFWGLVTTYPVRDEDGRLEYIDGAIEDISIRKNAETEIRHQAFYDNLTDLPNRTLLLERLEQQIILAQRQKYYSSVLFLDLDHFKNLNDALGHTAGDELLKLVAIRLREQIRNADTVARLGGDEFVVVLSNLTEKFEDAGFQANRVAEKIRAAIAQPFSIFEHSFQLTVSVGIVIFPSDGETAQDILKYADTAMYSAKRYGRDNIQFFQVHMKDAAEFRLDLESELHAALKNHRYLIHYQPLVDKNGKVLGAECLLRLNHSQGHIVSPVKFIPVAEEMGLIRDISLWILDEACRQLQIWSKVDSLKTAHLAINISARHFYRHDFIHDVQRIVTNNNIDPAHLVLEITEGMLLHNINEAIEKMNTLKTMGFRFAVDDFGTGYSSLAYLKRLPLDILKIDRSFVMDITTDEDALAITDTIISIARHLSLEIVAEGVETAAQLDLLHDRGCQLFQGYYFSQPLPVEEFWKYLEQ